MMEAWILQSNGGPEDPLRWSVRSRTGKFDVGLWVSVIVIVITVVLIL